MLKRAISLLCVLSMFLVGAATAANAAPNSYRVSRLVADEAGKARAQDPNLVNAWGLAAGPSTPWWVADADTDVSTIYDGTGAIVPLVVKVPGGPTGLVFNGGPGFVVSHDGDSGPSLFLFATESGTIRGWNPGVGTTTMPPSKRTFVVRSRVGQEANFKGLAIASRNGHDFIYATDFHNDRVLVFRDDLHQIMIPGAFEDPQIPDGFAPFGIQQIAGVIVVTYAKQDANAEDEVTGHGLGYVDAFTTRGELIGRVASRGVLDAPWGLALAPSNFGKFSNDLLVGNFGNGLINAFSLGANGEVHHDGMLRRPNGRLVWIDGLWALEFGNGGPSGPANSLYFTAGPDDEAHGLFGKIKAA
jgi:uncharacterized protein (TIGR03118 family)